MTPAEARSLIDNLSPRDGDILLLDRNCGLTHEDFFSIQGPHRNYILFFVDPRGRPLRESIDAIPLADLKRKVEEMEKLRT
jgi:hypothetical protein